MITLYFFKKTLKVFSMMALVMILVFTPLIVSISPGSNGKPVPTLEYSRALAVLNVGILENNVMSASYDNANTGNLTLKLTGNIPVGLGLLSQQYFVYQLPEELKPILSNPLFQNNAHIDYSIGLLFSGTIPGSELILNSGTVTGVRSSLLNLSVLTSVTATLTINLKNLNITKLPPSPDSKLEFYGIAAREAVINLNLLGSEAAYAEIATDELPPPPTINAVHDVDTSITGTGEPGATVHITTPDYTYDGTVNPDGTYSVAIPAQAAGTTITATQTKNGIESNENSTTVIGVILTFTVPDQLPFKTTTLGLQEVTIQRAVQDWSIIVHDTRGQGAKWKITARAEGPLKTSDGQHQLDSDALVFINGSNVYSLAGEVLIFDGTTGSDQSTTIQWSDNEGVLLKMTPMNLETGVDYATTIDWTLADAP